jgi:group I intron endonuclease
MNIQGYIYKTTNLINDKVYIGKSLNKDRLSYFGSGLYIKRAIRKYGRENFKREIIAYASDENKLNELEIAFIAEYRRVFGKKCVYNITSGGEGHRKLHSQETKVKIGKARKGSILSKEACINISNGYKKHKLDCKCIACKSRRGEYIHKEGCRCISCLSRKKLYTHRNDCICICCRNKRREFIIHKQNCRCASCKGKRGEYKGENNPMYGKQHTQETIKVMSKCKLGNKYYLRRILK